MTTAAAHAIPVVLPRHETRIRPSERATAPAVPVTESRDSSRFEDAASLSIMASIAVAGIGGLAWAGHVIFSEVTRLGLENAFQSLMGAAY